jgi:hypothetical protein
MGKASKCNDGKADKTQESITLEQRLNIFTESKLVNVSSALEEF